MKKLIIITALLVIPALGAVKTSVKLEWDFPSLEVSSVTFNLWHSTNVGGPFEVLTNVATTNVVVPISVGTHYYLVTATNEWGDTDPSNVVSATVPRKPQNLRIIAQ